MGQKVVILQGLLAVIASALAAWVSMCQLRQMRRVREQEDSERKNASFPGSPTQGPHVGELHEKALVSWPWWMFVGLLVLLVPPVCASRDLWGHTSHAIHLGIVVPATVFLLARFRPLPGRSAVVWICAILIGAVVVGNPILTPSIILQILLYVPVLIIARSICRRRLAGGS